MRRRKHMFYLMKHKLLYTYFVFLLALFALFFVIYGISGETIRSIASDHSYRHLEQINFQLEDYFDRIDSVSMSLISNNEIKKRLNATDQEEILESEEFIESVLHSIYISSTSLKDIIILDNEGNDYKILGSPSDFLTILSSFEPYFDRACAARGRNIWPGMHILLSKPGMSPSQYTFLTFPTLASFTDYYTGESLGILILNTRVNHLEKILMGGNNDNEEHQLYLLDENMDLLLFQGSGKAHSLKAEMTADQSGQKEIWRDNARYLLNYVRNERTGWYLAKLISIDELMESSQRMREIFMMIFIFLVLAGVFISVLFSRTMTRDIEKIHSVVQQVHRGNFDARINSTRRDEMAEISDEVDHLISGMQALIQNYAEQKEMAAEARFLALQSQTSPHFIYNSLNFINWKLINMGQLELSDMIVALSNLIRYVVNREDDFVAMQDELDHISDYILVCNNSMSGRIRYELHVHTDISKMEIPRLLVQPIVENAVKHGVSKMIGGGAIVLSIHSENNYVLVEVANEGIEPDIEHISRILRGDSDYTPQGTGLWNVQQRIQAIYGGVCGLSYRRDEQGRTVAVIRIYNEPVNRLGRKAP